MQSQFNFNLRSLRLFSQCFALIASVLFLSPATMAVDLPKSKVVIEQSVISINSANAQTIAASLSGVGISKAEAIVAWRKQNGDFKHVEQLLEVKGIGEKTLERNRSKISL